MTVPRMFRCPLATLALFALVTSLYGGALHGQAASPPSQPPVHWGAVSINLEDVPYPHKALQNAELVLIPNVGHNLHLEAPEIFNRELIRFLGSDRGALATER